MSRSLSQSMAVSWRSTPDRWTGDSDDGPAPSPDRASVFSPSNGAVVTFGSLLICVDNACRLFGVAVWNGMELCAMEICR